MFRPEGVLAPPSARLARSRTVALPPQPVRPYSAELKRPARQSGGRLLLPPCRVLPLSTSKYPRFPLSAPAVQPGPLTFVSTTALRLFPLLEGVGADPRGRTLCAAVLKRWLRRIHALVPGAPSFAGWSSSKCRAAWNPGSRERGVTICSRNGDVAWSGSRMRMLHRAARQPSPRLPTELCGGGCDWCSVAGHPVSGTRLSVRRGRLESEER